MKKTLTVFIVLLIAICTFTNKEGKSIDYFEGSLLKDAQLESIHQSQISKREVKVDEKIRKVETEGENSYFFNHGNMQTRFHESGVTEIINGSARLSITPKNINIGRSKMRPKFSKNPRVDKNKIFYTLNENVYEEFISTENTLKHNIYVKPSVVKGSDEFTYEWDIPLRNFYVETKEGEINRDFTTKKDIILRSNGSDIFKIEKPYAFEKGKDIKVYGEYEVVFSDNMMTLKMIIPMDSFQNAKNEIVIDPTVIGLMSYYGALGKTNKRSIAQDSKGNIYIAFNDSNALYEVFVTKSSDGGITWQNPVQLSDKIWAADAPTIAIDGNDNIYVMWICWATDVVHYSVSTDSGNSWNHKTIPNTMNPGYMSLSAKGNGDLYIAYVTWSITKQLFFIKSNDGGKSWSYPQLLHSQSGGSVYNYLPTIDVSNTGRMSILYSQRVYLDLGTDNRNHCHLFYTRSDDDGDTWSDLYSIEEFHTQNNWNEIRDISMVHDSNDRVHIFHSMRSRSLWGNDVERAIYRNYDGHLWSDRMIMSNESYSVYETIISRNQNDDLYFAWREFQNNHSKLHFRSRINGIWQNTKMLSRNDINNQWYNLTPNMPSCFNTARQFGGPFIIYLKYDWHGGNYTTSIIFDYLGTDTPPPPAPEIVFPENTGHTNGLFTWRQNTYYSEILYEVQISDEPNFTNILEHGTGITHPWYDSDALSDEDTVHYFRVRSADKIGRYSPWTSIEFYYDGTDPMVTVVESLSCTATGWWNIENPLTLGFTGYDSGGGGISMNQYWMSNETFEEVDYNWVNIENNDNTYPVVVGSNSRIIKDVPLNFNFPFYDGIFHKMNISSTGWISFEYNTLNSYFAEFPIDGNPKYTIAVYQDYLSTRSDGTSELFIANLETPKRKVVTFKNWGFYYLVNENITFQVVLYENGQIDINIQRGSDLIYSQLQIGANFGFNNRDAIKYYYSKERGITGPVSITYTPKTFELTDILDFSQSDENFRFSYSGLDNAGNNRKYIHKFYQMLDYGLPACTVTYPLDGTTVNQPALYFGGICSDNKSGIDDIEYSVDGNTWTSADDVGPTDWETLIALVPGENDVWFRAIDVAGNVGNTVSVRVIHDASKAFSMVTTPENGSKFDGSDFPLTIGGIFGHGTEQIVTDVEVIVTSESGLTTPVLAVSDSSGILDWKYSWTEIPDEGMYYIRSRARGDTPPAWMEDPNPGIWVQIGMDTPHSEIDAIVANLVFGETFTFTGTAWDDTSDIEKVDLGIRRFDETDYEWHNCTMITTGTWSMVWDVPEEEEAYYYLLSRAGDVCGYVEANTIPLRVMVDTKAPHGFVSKPVNNSNVSRDVIKLEGYCWDDASGMGEIQVLATDSENNTQITTWAIGNGDFGVDFSFPDTGTYTLNVDFIDKAGNIFRAADLTLTYNPLNSSSSILNPRTGDTIYNKSTQIKGEAIFGKGETEITKVEIGITPEGQSAVWNDVENFYWDEAKGVYVWDHLWTGYGNGNYTLQSRASGDTTTETPNSEAGINVFVNMPLPPTNVSLRKSFKDGVTVSWSATTVQNHKHYGVVRRVEGMDGFEIMGTTTALNFIDHYVMHGVRYEYAVYTLGENDQAGENSESAFINYDTFGDTLDDIVSYPNPFVQSRGFNTFKFKNLIENTTISIYKINGQLVKTIETVGVSQEEWDLKDKNDKEITTGVYLVVFKSDDEVRTTKIAIIK